ncbi:hypothetical protein M885DRAFT_506768 [Pelagophyceae sp. CCMP2097]|nr:hypothetical protein M885DRAFT_506768 [Pelagophyceae sp. CCMP2097]
MVQIRKALAPGIALCGARGGDEVGSCPGVHLASADSRGSVVSYGSLGCRRCRRGRPLAPLPIFRIRPPVVERLYVALLDAAVAAALRAAVAVAVDCEPEAPYGRDDVGPRPGETSNEPSAAEGFMAPATHGHKSLASSAKDSAASANSATPKLSSWPAKPASLAHWPSLQHTSDRMRCSVGPPTIMMKKMEVPMKVSVSRNDLAKSADCKPVCASDVANAHLSEIRPFSSVARSPFTKSDARNGHVMSSIAPTMGPSGLP